MSYLDAELHSLFEAMRRRGGLEKTLIIITSDHDEEFGEHGLWNHGLSPHLASVQLPLVVLAPGLVPAGSVVSTPVSVRDIPVQGPLRCIRNTGDGSEELFNFRADPQARSNLANENGSRADIARLRDAFEQVPRRTEHRR